MSTTTLVMWASLDDVTGPLLLAGVAAYEKWKGAAKMPGSDDVALDGSSPSKTLLWRSLGDDTDATCWVDEAKSEILYLQCGEGVDRDAAVAAVRGGNELPVGDVLLDGAFVVATAKVPASKVKTLPTKLMKDKIGGKPLSLLTMKRTDDDLGNVFPTRAGVWRVTRVVVAGPKCQGLWVRWAREA